MTDPHANGAEDYGDSLACPMTFHRWVIHARVPDYLRLGWLALPSLEGTGHGFWSVHCVWLCGCICVEPTSSLTSKEP